MNPKWRPVIICAISAFVGWATANVSHNAFAAVVVVLIMTVIGSLLGPWMFEAWEDKQ